MARRGMGWSGTSSPCLRGSRSRCPWGLSTRRARTWRRPPARASRRSRACARSGRWMRRRTSMCTGLWIQLLLPGEELRHLTQVES
uniref:Uncharacterized protein n=1 Tax=Arundo donax TaxID=35708 RepID=A0A0A9D1T3_ARUDO